MRLLLIMLFACCTAGIAAENVAAGPTIACLRLEEVIRTCKQYASRTETLSQEQGEAKKALKEMDEQLQQLDNQLKVLSRTNERFPKVQEDFEVLKLRQKLYAERAQTGIERRHVAIIKETYAALRQLLKEFCKERGIKLVHLAPNPDLKAPSMMEVQLELGLQSVLFADENLDITVDFIAFVNGKFAAGRPADAPPAAGAQPAAGPGK